MSGGKRSASSRGSGCGRGSSAPDWNCAAEVERSASLALAGVKDRTLGSRMENRGSLVEHLDRVLTDRMLEHPAVAAPKIFDFVPLG
jgi:hypothetical protein